MRLIAAAGLSLGIMALAGCDLSQPVADQTFAYHQTADLTANRIILVNILRAKDGAPLHFGELSLIHGQLSQQGSLSLAQPVGEIPRPSTNVPRAILTPQGVLGEQVTFDLGTLDTQAFTQGVTSPIAPRMLKYFLDNAMDYRLVLLLLVSSIRLPGNSEPILNYPHSSREVCFQDPRANSNEPLKSNELPKTYTIHRSGDVAGCQGHPIPEFVAFLDILNALNRVYAVSEPTFVPIGKPFVPDLQHNMREFSALDASKLRIEPRPGGLVQIGMMAESKIVLCQEAANTSDTPRAGKPASDAPGAGASDTEICGHQNAQALEVTTRSTLGIFAFLGQVLESQERRSSLYKQPVCVRLDSLRDANGRRGCDQGDILFNPTDSPWVSRFGVNYNGRYWGIPATETCDEKKFCDHTLETMSMVSLLLNLNKLARDIPSTPAVQVVP